MNSSMRWYSLFSMLVDWYQANGERMTAFPEWPVANEPIDQLEGCVLLLTPQERADLIGNDAAKRQAVLAKYPDAQRVLEFLEKCHSGIYRSQFKAKEWRKKK